MSKEKAKLIEFKGTAEEMKSLSEISKVAQEILTNEHHIHISLADAIPTIAYVLIGCTAEYLNKHKEKDRDVTVNLMNLIEMGVTYRESEDGEKDGNFTPFMQPGTIFKTLIKSDENTEDDDEE